MTRIALTDLGVIGVLALLELIARWPGEAEPLELVLADRRPLRCHALGSAVDALPGAGELEGRPRADALVELLAPKLDGRGGLSLRACTGPEDAHGWQACLEGCSLCLIPSDLAAQARVLAAHDAAYGAGVPSLSALACGVAGLLGPLSDPRASGRACLHCAVARITATSGSSPFAIQELPEPRCCERLARELALEALRSLGLRADDPPSTAGALRYLGAELDVRHSVLRSGACPGCGARGPFMPYRFARPAPLDELPRGPEHILELGEVLVSPLTGPIRTIQATQAPAHARVPRLQHWWAEARDPSLGGEVRGASGCAHAREPAQAAALGEAVERLASGSPRASDVFWASYAQLSDEGIAAVDSAAWDLFHPRTRARADFPYAAHDPTRVEAWVWGVALPANQPVALPVERVFAMPRVEHPVDCSLVSGFATGTCYAEAAERGLRETLERDAFMAAWHARLPAQRLLLEREDPELGPLLAAFEACELELRLASVRLDHGLELVIALSSSERPGEAAMCVSASADFDLRRAAHGALREQVTSRHLLASLVREAQGHFPRGAPEELQRMGDHGLLYARAEQREALAPWWEGEGTRTLPPPGSGSEAPEGPRARLDALVDRLARLELRVYTVDLTPPELGALGLRVVKALVPGTLPVQFDSRFPHLGGERLAGLPQRLGLRDAPLGFDDLRSTPHPFP